MNNELDIAPALKKKIVFIHIPKSAGVSIYSTLNAFAPIHVVGPHEKGRVIFSPGGKFQKEDCYVFTFVRNPWDRLVSTFFYILQGGRASIDARRRDTILNKYDGSFKKFVLDIENWINIREHDSIYKDQHIPHFRPQWEYIYDDTGACLADFIGKFETLDHDFEALCKCLGTPNIGLKKINKSKHKNYTDYYNTKMIDIVAQYYNRDIEYFGYAFTDGTRNIGSIRSFLGKFF